MDARHVSEVPGTEFPAGRRTRVMVGPESDLKAHFFTAGQVTIFPGGSVPAHSHPQEEVYIIASGSGRMTIGEESREVDAITYVYIPPQQTHSLTNTGTGDLVMFFTYAPAGIVDHWREEMEGKLK